MRGYAVPLAPRVPTRLTTAQAAAADLGIDDDPRLDQLVLQASALCESFCQRRFGRGSWLETFDGFDDTLVLSNLPVVSVESITVSEVPFDPAAWRVRSDSGLLTWRRRAVACPSPNPFGGGEEDETVVAYTAGYVLPGQAGRDLPGDIERACLETVKFLYYASGPNARDPMVRADSTEGIGQTSWVAPQPGVSSLPSNAADMLQFHKLQRA